MKKKEKLAGLYQPQDVEIPSKEGTILYKRFYQAIRMLPLRLQRLAYEMLFDYEFEDKLPSEETDKRLKQLFLLVQPQFDANERKRRNGFRGKAHGVKGADSGVRGGRPPKEDKDED